MRRATPALRLLRFDLVDHFGVLGTGGRFRRDLLLRRSDVDVVVGVQATLEVPDGLAEPFADLGQPSGAENQHHDQENDD